MNETISDTKLMFFLQKKLREDPKLTAMFRSTAYCHVRLVNHIGYQPSVFVLANENQASYFGLTFCKSPWICPVCSARRMSKYAAEIACALDALAQPKYNQLACMITFAIPHTRFMSCEETTEILYNSWKNFIARGNKRTLFTYLKNIENKFKHNQEKKLIKAKSNDPFNRFCDYFNCTHRVRICEYTWGEHGWHPHFHALFWVDADKIQEVASWQKELNERWEKLVEKNMIKSLNKRRPQELENNKKRVKIIFERSTQRGKNAGCHISVDKDNKVIIQKSSMYVCGWGADKELTGNYKQKASNEGHYTPHQLLEMAMNGDDEKFKLFIEYAKATSLKNHKRTNFSHTGLKQIIEEWKQTHLYLETLKKKAIDVKKIHGDRRMVCWFNEQQWFKISLFEMQCKVPLKYAILRIAQETKSKTIIDFLLAPLKVKSKEPQKHPNYKHLQQLLRINTAA